jgi:hypothetical protein
MGKDAQTLESVKLVYQPCSRSWAARTLTWVIYGTKFNLHMHCTEGVVITFVLLLNWVDIYLYLVIANKILTNFKSNAQLQLVERWTYVSSLLLSHTPHRSRTGIAGWGAWRMLWWVRERSRPSSPSKLWVVGSLSPYDVIIYLFYIELLLHSKDVTFVSVPLFIICVRLGPSTLGDYFAPGFWTPKIWVWQITISY